MKQTIDQYEFRDAFKRMNRADNFSTSGLYALFNYLEQYEQDTGEEIELDVISLCCDYTEDSIKNVLKEYKLESIDALRDHTTVIEVDSDTIIYQAF